MRFALAASLVGSLLVGCSSSGDTATEKATTAYEGRRGAPKLVIAGDSITELSRAGIVAALEDRYRVRVDAFTGRTIAEVTPVIEDQMTTDPDIAVVNLGTNDLDRENPNWRRDLDRMLRRVADVPCVVAVTIYDGRHPPADDNIGTRINARLASAAADGEIGIVDWNAAVHQDPALIVEDGIHPSEAGQRWLANSIREAVDADC